MAPRYSPFASPHYAGFSAHVRHTFPQWVILPTAVTNDDLRYARVFVQSQNSLILIWSKVDLRTSPTPSTGSAHARHNTSGVSLSHSTVPFFLSLHPRTDIFIHRSDPDSAPSRGPHHIARDFLIICVALTVTANEARRPSLEARSPRLLFCERGCDVINLFPSPLGSISMIFSLLLLVRLRHRLLHFLWNLEIILLQKNSCRSGDSAVRLSRA
jgi:hypothetical protein